MNSSTATLFNLFENSVNGRVYKWHHYLTVYESFFKRFRGKPLKVLEIGVLDGGSLRLWKNYFGDACVVYGVDINPAAKQYEDIDINIRIGDQSDLKFWANLIDEVQNFDIVIDDGAHTNYMISKSFEALYEHTNSLYVVEDTHALYWYRGAYSFFRDCVYALTGAKSIKMKAAHLFGVLNLFFTFRLSFITFAMQKANDLTTQWHRSPHNILLPGEKRIHHSEGVSNFAKFTSSIHFYDSLIIFEKSRQDIKVAEFK